MKNKELLNKLIQHFNGLKKAEAFDLISKMEVLLFYAPNPLQFDNNQELIPTTEMNQNLDIDPFQFTMLPNGNIGEFEGCNDFMHVYKEHNRKLPSWLTFTKYYFKSKYAPLELIKLTKNNIIEHFEGEQEEASIRNIIKKGKVIKRNLQSNTLFILEL